MPDVGTWLLVTPARNEIERLPKLAASLRAQTQQPIGLWVIVDDGSDDGTEKCIDGSSMPFRVEVLTRENTGGLLGASERVAFEDGVAFGLEQLPHATRIMKIDADLILEPDHLALLAAVPEEVGLVGGAIVDPGVHSQPHHVRGGLRAYNRAAWEVVGSLPMALGWDVLDEVAIREAGLEVRLVPEARATTSRKTWSSEGLVRGRVRGGVGMRWTGYHPVYFAIRVARHVIQRPYGVGAAGMVWGYVRAGKGPFSAELKAANRRAQTRRLRAFVRSPRRWSRENMRSSR